MFRQIVQKFKRHFYFKNDQQGIIRRYLNEPGHWNLHLTNCKSFITDELPKGDIQKVAILGSGWLLDVPVQQLLERCDEIHLFDINHPEEVKHKYRSNKNIRFITLDLTSNLVSKVSAVKSSGELEAVINSYKNTLSFHDFDYVVSINLLNQLDILLFDLIEPVVSKLSNRQVNDLRLKIQQQHLACLPKGKSCIITDVEELNYLDKHKLQKRKTLVFVDLPLTERSKEWIWEFDTLKNYRNNLTTSFKVVATNF